MSKLKDILYDKNDILVVLAILAVAAFIITGRIDAIMAYPQTILAQQEEDKGPIISSDMTGSEETKETDEKNSADASTDKSDDNAVAKKTTAEPTGVNYSVYIEYGSTGSTIAQTLLDCGLIKTKNEFYDAVTAANANSKLKAGSFIIPEGSTPAEIVQIITN